MAEELRPTTTLVAHRRPLLREGLASLIRHTWPEWNVVEAEDYSQVSERTAATSFELIVLDINLQGLNVGAGIARLRAADPNHCVIVLSDTDDGASAFDCLRAGACGYISPSATPLQFVRCIETVLSGGVFLPRTLVSAEQNTAECQTRTPVRFTDRQKDVLHLLSEGYSTKGIARHLGLSIGTVKVHLASIFRNLSVHSRVEAVIKARDMFPTGATSPINSCLACDTQPHHLWGLEANPHQTIA